MSDGSTILRLRNCASGPQPVERWRETVSPLWNIAVASEQAERFASRSEVFHLGTAILGRTAATAHNVERSIGLVARMGVDHILVQLRLFGQAQVRAGRHEQTVGPSDILLLDMSQPLSTHASDYEAITLALPRRLFAHMVCDPDELHGTVIRGATPLGRLAASHLRMLSAQAGQFSAAEATAVNDATAGLIAACAGPSVRATPDGESVRPAALLVARRFVEKHLASPKLNAAFLAKHFALSRSSLYRLFEPLGGVETYIRQRRLARAYADLASTSGLRPDSVQEVAHRWCFDSPARFVQAFRQEFDCTPSAVRASSRPTPFLAGSTQLGRDAGLFDWVMKLGA